MFACVCVCGLLVVNYMHFVSLKLWIFFVFVHALWLKFSGYQLHVETNCKRRQQRWRRRRRRRFFFLSFILSLYVHFYWVNEITWAEWKQCSARWIILSYCHKTIYSVSKVQFLIKQRTYRKHPRTIKKNKHIQLIQLPFKTKKKLLELCIIHKSILNTGHY